MYILLTNQDTIAAHMTESLKMVLNENFKANTTQL